MYLSPVGDIPNADRAFGSFGSGNITVELVNRLGREIVSGRFSASDSLPNEGALSPELKISRTAVREAIKMLTAKGLVGSRPRRARRCGQSPIGTFLIPMC
jgi:DNA-binding FadR family transcriptional regulator